MHGSIHPKCVTGRNRLILSTRHSLFSDGALSITLKNKTPLSCGKKGSSDSEQEKRSLFPQGEENVTEGHSEYRVC
jgi:hypothetical protein